MTSINSNHHSIEIHSQDDEADEPEFTQMQRELHSLNNEPENGESEEEFNLLEQISADAHQRDINGFRRKKLGVIFTDLSVSGMGGIKLPIITFPMVIIKNVLFPIMWFMMRLKGPPPEKKILSNFNGFVKPGEMCFVLGRPNSGCTTFLKLMANKRVGFNEVSGEVSYGAFDSKTIAKKYRGNVVYNEEDDVHHPTLTVGQTIIFAAKCKTPGKRLPKESKSKFQKGAVKFLLHMLGIPHTKRTVVGNAQVRGVSGGERKRVSIAEMLTTNASVLCWDNSTRGLDASSALQYAQSLKMLTRVYERTMFVTLYQAGEGIYNQFDKVCLINEGRQVYFGPASEARQYFVNLGYKNLLRQTTADYLTGCTDPNERQFQEDFDLEKIPKTAEDMEKAYLDSDICRRMLEERELYREYLMSSETEKQDFIQSAKDDHRFGTSKNSLYIVSVITQVKALIVREIQLKLQDRIGLFFSWATSISISIIIGSMYINLPKNSAGAFTRGGVIFLGLLFNVFLSFAELPNQMSGRPIMWRQTGFCFYRPGSLAIATTIADMPFSAPRILVFSVIVYMMAGLVRTAGAFFTYYVIVIMTYWALSAFFKLLGAISFSFDIAGRIASALLIAMVVYSGYIIPEPSMQRWLIWIYYANPVAYAFAALMGNEFGRIDLECTGTYVVPSGPGYPETLGPNQVCTLSGAKPGERFVSGEDYIHSSFRYASRDRWRNFLFEIAYFALFLVCIFIAVETLALGQGSPAINVFEKENSERKDLNKKLQDRKEEFRNGTAQQDLSGLISSRKPYTWENLTYDVSVPGGQRRLLDQIYGYVKPGTLTALMGSSGAGKTTLLDVLANRKNMGVIGGEILIAGRPPGPEFQRGTAYCEQQDVHEWTATVREAFRFSAYLRQPKEVSIKSKNAYVEEVIQLLEMEDLADAMIGFPGFGLGVEARKRVTIGVELAAKPQLLLFLDEPTSGLDGQSAYNIVRFLKKLAAAGQAILCTIHQPNAILFENFDRLLLLKKGGRCVYFGDIGKDSKILRSYFERQGALCPEDSNPAEFMLEAVGAGTARQMGGDKDWADRWLDSEEHEENKRTIASLKLEAQNSEKTFGKEEESAKPTEYAQPFWYQLKVVSARTHLAFFRNADYQFTRLCNHVTIGLIVGLTFVNIGNSLSDLQYKTFSIYMAGILPILIISQIEPSYIMSRVIHVREASSKTYSQVVFGLSQFLAELPYSALCGMVYFFLWYYINGLNSNGNRAGYAYLMILTMELYAITLGQAIASISPSIFIASLINPPIILVLNLFCGVTIPQPVMPLFWKHWMYNLDPYTRLIGGLLVNELHDSKIVCESKEFSIVKPPDGQTCNQWLEPFIKSQGGYVDNPDSNSDCRYCQYSKGDEYLLTVNAQWKYRWRDFGIFIGYAAFNFVFSLIAVKYLTLRYAKR
ncbi:ABC-2 type transporter-domain-containing protein [Phakopsora pachyrhizi]|uniref:ABC-2 type transporter-domain-containing protein n=1 Tax=Phakopsora pachyrhizi TaxID=170000 RepID=A0AAV0B266_PHAPC|nr:ABC-2 type transporter-domain-containing protein [Phakopsora pachyrhizi]